MIAPIECRADECLDIDATGGIAGAARMERASGWRGAGFVFIVSALALAVVVLLAARSNKVVQQGSQLSPTALPLVGSGRFSVAAVGDLFHRISANYSREVEDIIRQQANMIPAGVDRDTYLFRAITVCIILVDHEITWYNIFASQIHSLQRLNDGPLRREGLFPFYSNAAVASPHVYAAYSFDQWLGFMRTRGVIREDGDMVGLTVKDVIF